MEKRGTCRRASNLLPLAVASTGRDGHLFDPQIVDRRGGGMNRNLCVERNAHIGVLAGFCHNRPIGEG